MRNHITTPALPATRASAPAGRVLPLWPVLAATAWLGLPPHRVDGLLKNGSLPWAWNIARRGSRQREIRIWFNSLAAWKNGAGCGSKIAAFLNRQQPFQPSRADVIDDIIGVHRPALRTDEVCAILNCNRMTVARHLADDELRVAPGFIRRRRRGFPRSGSHASPRISRASLAEFLEKRLL